jgi:hypothetical protein
MDGFANGRHRLHQEGDLVQLGFAGALTLADVTALRSRVEEVIRCEGRCFVLADLAGLTGMAPDARRYLSEWGRSPRRPIAGTALYGGNFATRVLTTLVLNAIQLMGRSPVDVVFKADEAEARRWLTARRAGDEVARVRGGP